MADPASDFMSDYQSLAQQSWDAWTRQFQQAPATNPFVPPPAPAAGNETLERTLAGLKGYFDWMQAAMASGGGAKPANDWQQQLQQMFGGATQPFTQAFGSIDSANAESFARQWQSWWQATQHSGFGDLPGMKGPTPAFGLNREQQMKQQALVTALLASMQASARYQELIRRANLQGMQRLQDKLAEHTEPGRQIDSMKGLYDLWVDASEEAYADIALSDEFRDAYGEMVDTQMRARRLQQEQTEQLCQELGVPTRSEVSSLGERLQALRREFRANHTGGLTQHADDIAILRREVAALKHQLGKPAPAAVPAVKKTTRAKSAPTVKKTARVTSAPAAKKAARAKSAPAAKKVARAKSASSAKKAAAKTTRKAATSATSGTSSRKRK